jgi:hypothetical protein
MTPARGYAPIEDHALLADCHGAALVTGAGVVDWGAPQSRTSPFGLSSAMPT